MAEPLQFEWDSDKAAANFVKHGISFNSAVAVFADPDVVFLDTTRDQDGERRQKAIGLIEGRLFVVVFTLRDEVYRLISARPTNASEERSYGDRSSNS
ncbi:MAG: BrnT family toxin [Hyphomicrobiales bacterium]